MLLDNCQTLTKERIKQINIQMKLSGALLALPQTIKTANRIEAMFAGVTRVPSHFEIEETYMRFIHALKISHWGDVSPKDWKMAAYVLWNKDDESVPLGSNPTFLNRYINWMQLNHQPSNWRKLIHVYLRDFGYRKNHTAAFKQLAETIQTALAHPLLSQRLSLWKIRHEKFGLFSAQFLIERAATAFLHDAGNNWDKFIDVIGLTGELSNAGYADAVGEELLRQLTDSPNKELLMAVIQYHFYDEKLRFSSRRSELIEAMLSPWVKVSSMVDEEIRKAVQDKLLIQFNDPRLPIHRSSGWRGVEEPFLQVMFKWLIKETLEQFFAIIDQWALDHQWEYRKAFWKAYHDQGLLDGVWVALGTDVKSYAKQSFGNAVSFGELVTGAEPDQSVLIIRIQNLVLVEWSHHGKCRAWRVDDNELCPHLYKEKYNGAELNATSMKIVSNYKHDGISHLSSETYSWQTKLSSFIYDQTGIRIQHRDFKI